jgi:hypothetical protein
MPRRLLSFAVAAVLAGLLAGPAHAGPVSGTPFTITEPRGPVAAPIVAAVASGVRLMQSYERRRLGVTVRQPVELRVVPGARCDDRVPFLGDQVGGVTYDRTGDTGYDHLICLFTGLKAWPKATLARRQLAAHEAAHVLANELGCGPAAYWIHEGMAELLSWRAVLVPHLGESALRDDAMRWLHDTGELSPGGLRPREASRRGLSYLEAALAIAEADRGDSRRDVAFCRAVGAGTSWPKAFGQAYGVDVNTFYARWSRVRGEIQNLDG